MYSDVSTSRTLAATSTTSGNMTIEACVSFCDGGGYNYAGLEFGHCDSTIQVPSQPAALSDCNFGCSGNPVESCGASNRLNIIYNGKASPKLVSTVKNANGDSWAYQGCYTDVVSARTLAVPVNIPIGVTAESCVAACQSLGGYTYAGMEIGRECWCDNAIGASTQRVSDNDCRMVCTANHNEYCGNTNRIAVYHFASAGTSTGPQPCLSTNVANFTLLAAYKNPPVNGPSSVKLKVVLAELVPNIAWGVLSTDVGNAVGSPPLLSFGGKADAFSLCTNLTANNRLDVVYSPVTGHPHYTLNSCNPISIQVITG
ncbi:hypothetical protein DXG01_004744 [Tephrocybe rancida]|nr:hypothetical protein DXG01_004744 [Tephrocybe rancida]